MSYSSFKERASVQFPSAKWTGGGAIHASIARASLIDVPYSATRKVIQLLDSHNIGGKIYSVISRHCPNMEWLFSHEQLHDLLMVDAYRMLHGQGAASTPKSLVNPRTKNVFHRVSLVEEAGMVGGVRIWLQRSPILTVSFGWRFRLEEQVSEAINIRAKALEVSESIQEEIELISDYVKQEPLSNAQLEVPIFEEWY